MVARCLCLTAYRRVNQQHRRHRGGRRQYLVEGRASMDLSGKTAIVTVAAPVALVEPSSDVLLRPAPTW